MLTEAVEIRHQLEFFFFDRNLARGDLRFEVLVGGLELGIQVRETDILVRQLDFLQAGLSRRPEREDDVLVVERLLEHVEERVATVVAEHLHDLVAAIRLVAGRHRWIDRQVVLNRPHTRFQGDGQTPNGLYDPWTDVPTAQCSKGHIYILNGEDRMELIAPATVLSPAGVKRAIYAVEAFIYQKRDVWTLEKLLERVDDVLAEARRIHEGGDHHHREGHHDRLVDADPDRPGAAPGIPGRLCRCRDALTVAHPEACQARGPAHRPGAQSGCAGQGTDQRRHQ